MLTLVISALSQIEETIFSTLCSRKLLLVNSLDDVEDFLTIIFMLKFRHNNSMLESVHKLNKEVKIFADFCLLSSYVISGLKFFQMIIKTFIVTNEMINDCINIDIYLSEICLDDNTLYLTSSFSSLLFQG